MEHTEPDDEARAQGGIHMGLLTLIGLSNLIYLGLGILIGLRLTEC